MDVSLPPQLDDFVRAQVRNGRYADEQEVVRDALRQMRALVKATEDPTVSGLVRDAHGYREPGAARRRPRVADRRSRDRACSARSSGTPRRSRVRPSTSVRKVPGARELDRVVRGPIELLTATAERGEVQAKAIRQNLEATAKALGVLTAVLERVNGATRTVNNVISPSVEQ